MTMLDVKHVRKTYVGRSGGTEVEALKDVTFTVEEGEFVAVMGESGSGKTTLLNLLAALDRPTGGEIFLDGQNLFAERKSDPALWRRKNLGFVFQEFNLLDTFTLRDNIYLPLVLNGENVREIREKAEKITDAIGISGILDKYPFEVSGGQKQRAAVARALITSPKLLLADEPTGALDSASSAELLRVFGEINRAGQTVLMVTHSVDAASHAGRILFIRDGTIFHQIYRGNATDEELYKKISDTLTLLRTGGDES